ncbi:MAG: PilZ domain-containing protein, partial [Acidobacteria bacterium]|nr:PilZ domain-containing protein [Acidobacteriota bacterium]
ANDRRTSLPRIKPKKVVLVEYPNYLSRVRDLSPVGAFIEDRRYLPPGQHVSLKLWLDSISPIPIDVTVRRVDEGHGIGVQFASLKESDYDRLRQFCRAQPQNLV